MLFIFFWKFVSIAVKEIEIKSITLYIVVNEQGEIIMDILKLKDFPEDFLWGASSSAYQCEGLGMKMEKAHLYKIWLQL